MMIKVVCRYSGENPLQSKNPLQLGKPLTGGWNLLQFPDSTFYANPCNYSRGAGYGLHCIDSGYLVWGNVTYVCPCLPKYLFAYNVPFCYIAVHIFSTPKEIYI